MAAIINTAGRRRTVLVSGAQGVSGRAVVEHYSKLPGTMVYGLSRRELAGEGHVKHISVDLLNANDIKAKLSPIQGITHLFFGAYIDKQEPAERSAINVQLLKGLLDYLGANVPTLRAICGFSVGSAMNLILVIGVYAAICREMSLPLRFPGPQKVYDALYQITSANILAEATIWAGETDAAKNEIFNVTNGDTLRWKHMWARIGKMFDMEIAEPVPFLLTKYMADKAPVWDAIVKKHGLRPIPYEQLVSWGYGDFAFRQDFDNVSSTIKVRQAGFHDCIDSETMFSQFFQKLAEIRVLPTV